MSKTIEKKIQLKAILIYLIVAFICGGMITFVLRFRKELEYQKEQVAAYKKELFTAEEFIREVNATQVAINQYAATRITKHYANYQQGLTKIDSLVYALDLSPSDSLQKKKLDTIRVLLKAKGQVVARLNRQLIQENPIDTINQVLSNYVPPRQTQSYIVATTQKDTITKVPPKKGFWKRFSDLISPARQDTTQTVSTVKTEIIKLPHTDSLPIVPEIKGYATQASSIYTGQIQAIEKHIRELIAADQKISTQLSNLLIDFYSQTVYSKLEETQRNERWMRRNNFYSILTGVAALALILLFILLIINDVNKGYHARKTLEEANFRIKQILESRHQLLLAISHDIKSPLNSILGYLELRNTKGELSSEEIKTMQNSGQHILSLLENLLDFSSIEQGRLRLTETLVNPLKLCQETAGMFESLAKQKELHFACHFDLEDKLWISTDALKLKQILSNLLSNAIKYTTEGGVIFTASYQEHTLRFQIVDTGAGIPRDEQTRIFNAFERVEGNNRLAEGSGFGLYVVKGLVHLFKGEIRLVSDQGKGTRMEVSLPVEEASKTAGSTKNTNSKQLLVVDDDLSFLAMISNMLTALGHRPITCPDLKTFKEKIRQISPGDYVLTDMEMGCFNGLDILAISRENIPPIPVIVMTARTDLSPQFFKEKGFTAFIPKPVTLESLYDSFGGSLPYKKLFSLLNELLEEDSSAVREVLTQFLSSSGKQLDHLRRALSEDNFQAAQAICHQMLSMYLQLEASDVTPILQKVDRLHGKEASSYPGWKEELEALLPLAERWRQHIEKQLTSS